MKKNRIIVVLTLATLTLFEVSNSAECFATEQKNQPEATVEDNLNLRYPYTTYAGIGGGADQSGFDPESELFDLHGLGLEFARRHTHANRQEFRTNQILEFDRFLKVVYPLDEHVQLDKLWVRVFPRDLFLYNNWNHDELNRQLQEFDDIPEIKLFADEAAEIEKVSNALQSKQGLQMSATDLSGLKVARIAFYLLSKGHGGPKTAVADRNRSQQYSRWEDAIFDTILGAPVRWFGTPREPVSIGGGSAITGTR